jgi:hypothetical protein
MNDLDHMLNGKGSRDHLQDMIQQAQQAKFARKIKPSPAKSKFTVPFRAILIAFINLIVK